MDHTDTFLPTITLSSFKDKTNRYLSHLEKLQDSITSTGGSGTLILVQQLAKEKNQRVGRRVDLVETQITTLLHH